MSLVGGWGGESTVIREVQNIWMQKSIGFTVQYTNLMMILKIQLKKDIS